MHESRGDIMFMLANHLFLVANVICDHFCMNGTFKGKLANIYKATKVIHNNFRRIINGVTDITQ